MITQVVKIWIFILIKLFYSVNPSYAQTCIVAVKTTSHIYIGADSKAVDAFNPNITKSFCKIRIKDQIVFAYAGKEIPPDDFLFNVIDSSFAAETTFVKKINRFVNNFIPPLKAKISERIRGNNFYFETRLNNVEVFQIIFATIENNSPKYIAVFFKPIHDGFGNYSINIRHSNCLVNCTDTFKIEKLGRYNAVEDRLAKIENFWVKNGYINGIRNLITYQAQKDSVYVGLPVNIIQISRSGVSWIDQKPPCAKK